MIEELAAALATLDRKAAKRLVKCLPVLGEALARWHGNAEPDALVLACATPRSAIVLSSAGWPQLDPIVAGKVERSDAALALASAIKAGASAQNTDVILSAVTVLLGEEGLKAHTADSSGSSRTGFAHSPFY